MFNTDMADERVDEYKKVHNLTDVDGIKVEKNDFEEIADRLYMRLCEYPDDETHPNTEFVGIDGEGYGFAALNSGLYEYEHMNHPITGKPVHFEIPLPENMQALLDILEKTSE